jgi:excisionase family DNA binding protein
MKTFSVKEIAEMLNMNPETVRRWIRSGKLEAIRDSRKEGNIVTEQMLNAFLKSSPKYAGVFMASTAMSPIAGLGVMTVSLLTGLIAQQYVKNENEKNAKVNTTEIKKLLISEIKKRTQAIRRKEEVIRQLQSEIEVEQAGIEEAWRLIKEMDAQTEQVKEGEN